MTGYLLALCMELAGFLVGGCPTTNEPFALYRSSALDAGMVIYVARFDAPGMQDGGNAINCATAASLFQNQPGVTVRYWCQAI